MAKETLRNTYDKLDKELSAGFSNEKGANAGVETSASKINREDSEDYYLSVSIWSVCYRGVWTYKPETTQGVGRS